MASESIQMRPLAEADMDLARLLSIAHEMEAAQKYSQNTTFNKHSTGRPVKGPPHGKDNATPRNPACYRHGGNNYDSADCHHGDSECHHCGKLDHIEPACRQKVQPKTITSDHEQFCCQPIPQAIS